MDIITIAEENFLISFAVTLTIGILQGAILGRGIRNRFPSLKRHARIISLILLILFAINATVSVLKFAIPEKFSFSNFTIPTTPEEGISTAISVLGLDAGLWSVIAMSVSVTLVIIFKFAKIHQIARYFMFTISVIIILVALISRFTDFVPTLFEVMMYAFYQFGITIGIFFVTRRRGDELMDFSWFSSSYRK